MNGLQVVPELLCLTIDAVLRNAKGSKFDAWRSGMPTVLVADDVFEVLTLIGGTLRKTGYTVFEASGGVDALRILQSQPVDVLVTDVKMPDLTGAELVRRAWQLNPDLAVVFITGYFAANEVPCEMLRQTLVLTKPFLPNALRQAVTQALDGRKAPAQPSRAGQADKVHDRRAIRPITPQRVA